MVDMMTNEFIDELIFTECKDICFKNAKKFYDHVFKRYRIKEKKVDIYKRIINYQIKKYGMSLNECNKVIIPSKEELRKLAVNMRNIKYQKRNRKGT